MSWGCKRRLRNIAHSIEGDLSVDCYLPKDTFPFRKSVTERPEDLPVPSGKVGDLSEPRLS